MALNGKYLEDADRLLAAGDYVQASEKYWGAVAVLVKLAATRRRWRHSSHYDLRQAISKLAREAGDEEILVLFSIAESLHANFYENFMTGDDVRFYSPHIHRLIDRLRPLTEAGRGNGT